MSISGLVITFNEEKNIGKCVRELFKVCNEVIVIDSFSSDNTAAVARENGAAVYLQEYLGDGPQRSYGLQFCKSDWILNLDADEFLDEDAVVFIKDGVFLNRDADAYYFRVKNYLGSRLIDFSGWYPDNKIRFFNKKTARPSEASVHQSIIAQKPQKVKVHILHYGWDSLAQFIHKKNQYTTWQAEELFNKGRKVSAFTPFLHAFVSFIRCYFFKRGVFNGVDGFTFAYIQAFFSYLKYAKLIHLLEEKDLNNKK